MTIKCCTGMWDTTLWEWNAFNMDVSPMCVTRSLGRTRTIDLESSLQSFPSHDEKLIFTNHINSCWEMRSCERAFIWMRHLSATSCPFWILIKHECSVWYATCCPSSVNKPRRDHQACHMMEFGQQQLHDKSQTLWQTLEIQKIFNNLLR